ncbi:DNA polymerase III subunit delta [Alisedimentitalea sp. MJ-SS2]|uniref:DNA polymerase III subunit delta n=1 Tax=Aliisedimentitalea sp. MJ-SS2 TaxID=3049795 RepID=UPI00290DEBA7|nr:DNA polymerase III subunit delta [Alisedimentitalea sp. MJ-SS2]MDU8929279.1 DNA polymerase III subunit delta [Alisedimentitalea sp. MJ-SS2]
MKLSTRDAVGYFKRPDPDRTGLLIYGSDAMRVALRRQEVIAALIGPNGDDEMRLTRIPAGELRKDKAMLLDAIKAQGFFPGPRVAFVEDATDVVTPIITAALEDWAPGDAQVVVTAGALKASSKLRKLFEGHKNAYATGIYDDPPSRGEIEDQLKAAGVAQVSNDAMTDLVALSRELGPGDLRQVIEKLGLYKLNDDSPASSEDVAAVAPTSTEAALDDVLNIVAEGKSGEIGPVMQRLNSQGVQPVALCIGATRHFRALYTAASDPGGAAQGIARMRPPIFGPRRDRMLRQAQGWGARKLETALGILTDTDLQLRSAEQRAPAMALVERALIRLAMLGRMR